MTRLHCNAKPWHERCGEHHGSADPCPALALTPAESMTIARKLNRIQQRAVGHLRALDDCDRPREAAGWYPYGAERATARVLARHGLVRTVVGGLLRLNDAGVAVSDALVGRWPHDDARAAAVERMSDGGA